MIVGGGSIRVAEPFKHLLSVSTFIFCLKNGTLTLAFVQADERTTGAQNAPERSTAACET